MDALFIIQEKGPLWIESDMDAKSTAALEEGETVTITLGEKVFKAKVLKIAPVINPENQTRRVRFSFPPVVDIAPGLKSSVKIALFRQSLKVKKTSVIKEGGTQIVFVRTSYGFTAVPVKVLAEGDEYYYLEAMPRLRSEIAVNSVAILKNMLGGGDE
jgi:multidrug efflux pump subunit AcrA (membrane-fusion protein)